MVKHTNSRFVVPAIFSIALLVSITSIMTAYQAQAASFVWRVPPYANAWSFPWQKCEYGPGVTHCAFADRTNGVARVYSMDNACQYCTVVGARHNVDPPVANPLMTTTQYRNLYFYSLLDGKFKIVADQVAEGGEMRYGGWTAVKRAADGVWVKDMYFYVYKSKSCGSSCGSTVYTIPSTNVIFVKGYNAGSYSMGSLFDAYAWGDFQLGTEGIVDAYTTSLGYGFTSDQLAIQWCDGGTC